jgi:hypothetical protein
MEKIQPTYVYFDTSIEISSTLKLLMTARSWFMVKKGSRELLTGKRGQEAIGNILEAIEKCTL